MRFKREQHLRTQADFTNVRSSGFRRECGVFLFHLTEFEDRVPKMKRVGVIASRRVGGAVQRNLCKRRLRELFRNQQDKLPENIDLVLVARTKLLHVSQFDLESKFFEVIDKFNAWKTRQS